MKPKQPYQDNSKSGRIIKDKNNTTYLPLKYDALERNINHDAKRSSLVTELWKAFCHTSLCIVPTGDENTRVPLVVLKI